MKKLLNAKILIILSFFFSGCTPQNDADLESNADAATAVDTSAQAISFSGQPLFPPPEAPESQKKKDSLLLIAKENYQTDPMQLEHIIWYGRRLAYLSRYKEAIKVYTKGLESFPNAPELYRHRGHRYISTRQLDKALADFKKAAELVADRPIEIEPDGIPNKLNKPLSTLQFNIWYHWGLALYLKGDFKEAAQIYEQCLGYSTNPDLLCATSDWLYMTYRRLGEDEKAEKVLRPINPKMEIIENQSYFNRLMMYKGKKMPEELLDLNNTNPDRQLDVVTQGYGVGNWFLYNGQKEKAVEIFEKMIKTNYWSAFGYIAAEADLQRL